MVKYFMARNIRAYAHVNVAYTTVQHGPRVQESILILLSTSLSLLSSNLIKIDLNGCSLDYRPIRDLLCK